MLYIVSISNLSALKIINKGVFYGFLKNIMYSETKYKNFAIWKDRSPGTQLSPVAVNTLT